MSVKICSCGHVVSRHELLGTEYARCQRMWHCYCSGEDSGVAVLEVEESVENPSGSTTNGRFFRRKWEPTKQRGVEAHPLNVGVRRLVEENVEFGWLVKCSFCGEWSDLTAYPVVDGTVHSVLYGVANRSILLCHSCSEGEEF